MTVSTDLTHPDLPKIFLAEVTAGEQLTLWTLDTGTTYYATAIHEIVDVKEDGASLTSRASVALVNSNAGSYFYDRPNSRVYVHTTGSADAHTVTIQALDKFYFDNRGKNLNGRHYEPFLTSAPSLSLRIEPMFTGIQQISGGAMTFSNGDQYFSTTLAGLQWDAGSVVLKLGIDRNGIEMAYGDYQVVGTWLISNVTITDTVFTLALTEYKVKIKKKIPLDAYDRITYPNIEQDDEGKAIQIAYGLILDAKPRLIDVTNGTFKVAGHGITEFIQVRVKSESTGVWNIKSFDTKTEASGQFTLGSSDWTYGEEVAVDFKGKEKSAGVVMDNPSDIIKDLLETYLEESASINAASFTESYNRLHGGTIYASTDLKTFRAVGFYLDEFTPVEKKLEEINFSVGSYLFANSSGEFIYKVFWPARSEGLPELTATEIAKFDNVIDNNKIYSKARINYRRRLVREWAQFKEFEKPEFQFIHDEKSARLVVKDTLLTDRDDAEILAERTINYEGKPQKVYRLLTAGRVTLELYPGDFINVNYPKHGVDGVYEVLSVTHDLLNDSTNLIIGDSHGLADTSGFWVAASDTLPARFANDAGYGAGSLAWNLSWSDAIALWAIKNVGYVCNSNGYANASDPRSFKKSTWI